MDRYGLISDDIIVWRNSFWVHVNVIHELFYFFLIRTSITQSGEPKTGEVLAKWISYLTAWKKSAFQNITSEIALLGIEIVFTNIPKSCFVKESIFRSEYLKRRWLVIQHLDTALCSKLSPITPKEILYKDMLPSAGITLVKQF